MPITVSTFLVASPISSVLSSSRNLRDSPLYAWYSATPMKIAPARPTRYWPPGQPSTPAVCLWGLLELELDDPRRMVTASTHRPAYAQPLAAAAILPNVEWSPPPS